MISRAPARAPAGRSARTAGDPGRRRGTASTDSPLPSRRLTTCGWADARARRLDLEESGRGWEPLVAGDIDLEHLRLGEDCSW